MRKYYLHLKCECEKWYDNGIEKVNWMIKKNESEEIFIALINSVHDLPKNLNISLYKR